MPRKSDKARREAHDPRAPIPRIGEGKRGEQGYLGYLLRQAANAQRRRMDQALAEVDLTLPQFLVLTMIRAYPSCSSADVARLAMLTPQTVHGIIANLVRRRLIERRKDPVHGRILTIELTAQGQELSGRARSCAVTVNAQLQRTLTRAEETVIRRWLVGVAQGASGEGQSD